MTKQWRRNANLFIFAVNLNGKSGSGSKFKKKFLRNPAVFTKAKFFFIWYEGIRYKE